MPRALALPALMWLVAMVGCSRPDFHLADGTPGRYAEWEGKWVIINYWAEWCAPCRAEIPELNALHLARAGHGTAAEILVVGINFDGIAGADLEALIARMGIEFPVLIGSPRTRWEYPMPSVLPMSVVIRPDGTVAASLVGPQTRATLEAVMLASPAQRAAGG